MMNMNKTFSNVSHSPTARNVLSGFTCHALSNWREIVMMICFCIVFLVGVIGNLLILLVFIPRLKVRGHLDLLIVYLGVVDLLASVFGPMVFIYWISTCYARWDFGSLGCKILPSLSRISVNVSIGVVLIMAIDRCNAITATIRRRNRRVMIHMSVAAVFFLSFVSESYYMNVVKLTPDNRCVLPQIVQPVYSLPLIALTIVRDLVFIAIFSATTAISVIKLRKSSKALLVGNYEKTKRSMSNTKTVKLLIAMMLVFGLLVIPRDVLHITYAISWLKWPTTTGISHK